MERRSLLTGAAAALLGAVGLGRVVTRGETPGPTAAPPTSAASSPPAARPAPTTSSRDATSTPSPEPPPAPSSEPTGTSSPAPSSAPTAEPTPAPTTEPASAPEPEPTEEPTPAPSPAPVVVSVLCRDAWRAAPAGDGLVAHELRRMTVHHSAVPLTDDRDAPARLRQHQRYHQDQGWPDIAYHLGIDRRGNVYELRTTAARGDTFTSYDPTGHLLLLAEGDFDRQQPTDAQLEGLARLLAWGATHHGLPLDDISGHRDHAQTSCPGDALHARLPDLRARATELVAAGGVATTSNCGDEGRRRVADIEAGRA